MSLGRAVYNLHLLGPFRLLGPNGRRIDVSSKKGQALIAMLVVSGGGERTRSWLQMQLWGSRASDQAQASLRSELSALRKLINVDGAELLGSDSSRIWINLELISVDVRSTPIGSDEEFLQGLDIPSEEGFEDWLREERQRVRDRAPTTARSFAATEQAAAEFMPSSFAALPALAVLPFANQTGDAELDIIAEGISEDLIDRLSRLRWLPIISRSSSFMVGRDIAARALGARYMLEGGLRLSPAGIVLGVSLTDGETGQVVWSKKTPFDDGSPTSLEDLLTGLTSALGSKIDQQEQSLALRKPQSDLNVRELIWRGRWHLNRFTREDAQKAKSCFDEALRCEPNSPEALIQHTWARMYEVWANRGDETEKRDFRHLAQKAIVADYDDARGHMLAGIAECWLRQPIRAEALLTRAIELNPSLVLAHAQLGSAVVLRSDPEEAIKSLNWAIRLSPNDHDLFYTSSELALCYLMIGNYSEALKHAENSVMRRAAYWHAHVIRINVLARMGQLSSAQLAVAELMSSNPKFDETFIDWLPFVDAKWNQFLKDGLNLATT